MHKVNPLLIYSPPSVLKEGPFTGSSDFDLETFVNERTDRETMPQLEAVLCQSPLYDVDLNAVFMPHLMDAYATGITQDQWVWESSKMEAFNLQELEVIEDEKQEVEPEFEVTDTLGLQNLMDKNKDKRGFIIFRRGLRSAGVVPNKSIDLIFRGWDELLPHHISFLKELQEKDQFAKLYGSFIASYMMSVKTEKECQANEKYLSFIQDLAKSPEAKKQELKDLLPIPVQRIGKYPLLLRETHPDHQDLKLAFETVKTLAEHVNDKKRQEEERTGLFQAYSQTKNCPARLVSAKRRWIVNVPCTESRGKSLLVMVFSDLIMLAVPITKSILFGRGDDQYQYKFVHLYKLEIKIDLSLSPVPQSSKSSAHENSASKDLLGNSLILHFTGYEGQKNYNTLKSTLASEGKTCRQVAEQELLQRKGFNL
ncbi:Dbl homology domain-containing protein [Gorgonomyces haynaldii]|nr:Dbl homology domain-containing protein [Gorgonomyces haynaldii]